MEHVIRNFDALAENDLRRDALTIAEAGYRAVNTDTSIRGKVQVSGEELRVGEKKYQLAGRRIFFVGVGKCSIVAAHAIEKLFGERITSGIAFDVSDTLGEKLEKIEVIVGTHPLPSEENVQSTERIMGLLSGLGENDLVIFVISGGGSTLLCLPELPMLYSDESELFKKLTSCGAPIQEMNIVRKHISLARGGGLARAAYPAEIVSLIISDVPGNDIEFISSGPTVLDSSTTTDAEKILVKYGISTEKISLIETPKEEKYFERVANILFLTNQDALSAMRDEAAKREYATEIVSDNFAGEAREVGLSVAEKLRGVAKRTAFLYAGESTVTLGASSGTGGRNQEMALAVLETIGENELILPFASDGHDNTEHAGAIGDAVTIAHANAKNLSVSEYLDAHRSYDFFSTTGDALATGYTGSNVSDFIIALKK